MTMYFTVDRIDGDVALLADDDGRVAAVAWLDLPEGTDEGVVLFVDFDDDGDPDWSSALIDDDERLRRERVEADPRYE